MMHYLLDTHILLWAAAGLVPESAKAIMVDEANTLYFSPASFWEIGIKRNLGRFDFDVDPEVLRRELLEHQYQELPITSLHALTASDLPPIHKDPFDRMLVAQARVEGFSLITADAALPQYPASIVLVRR